MLRLDDPLPAASHGQPRQPPAHEVSPDVLDYYRQTIEDYQTWSREGYMHFGLWRRGINPLNRRRMLEAMNDLVFATLQLQDRAASHIGDLGCGVGAVSRYGCSRFPRHHWTAVTVCPEQVAWGRTRLDRAARERVCLVQADYCHLPLPDASLDAAFFLESLCHTRDPATALAETARVLKPGGRLVVVDGMLKNPASQTPRHVNWLAGAVARNWAVDRFHHVPGFERAAADCGFAVEQRRELGWQIAPCVAHSPLLVSWHTIGLLATGQWTQWKRKHMAGCMLGVALGAFRRQFGYYLYSLRKF